MLRWVLRGVVVMVLLGGGALGAAMALGAAARSPMLAYDHNDRQPVRGNTDVFVQDLALGISRRLTWDMAYEYSPAWSPDGTMLAYVTLFSDGKHTRDGLHIVTPAGRELRRVGAIETLGNNAALSWSPDGRTLAAITLETYQAVVLVDVATGEVTRTLTDMFGHVFTPAYSPDGTRLVVAGSPTANVELYIVDAHSGARLDKITDYWSTDNAPAWSPDGAWIAFTSDRAGQSDIYIVRPNGDDMRRLTENQVADSAPAWTSDGRILFSSMRSGYREIYRMNADGSDVVQLTYQQHLVSNPAWRP